MQPFRSFHNKHSRSNETTSDSSEDETSSSSDDSNATEKSVNDEFWQYPSDEETYIKNGLTHVTEDSLIPQLRHAMINALPPDDFRGSHFTPKAHLEQPLHSVLQEWKRFYHRGGTKGGAPKFMLHALDGRDAYNFKRLRHRDKAVVDLYRRLGNDIGFSVRLATLEVEITGVAEEVEDNEYDCAPGYYPDDYGPSTAVDHDKPYTDVTFRIAHVQAEDGPDHSIEAIDVHISNCINASHIKEMSVESGSCDQGDHPCEGEGVESYLVPAMIILPKRSPFGSTLCHSLQKTVQKTSNSPLSKKRKRTSTDTLSATDSEEDSKANESYSSSAECWSTSSESDRSSYRSRKAVSTIHQARKSTCQAIMASLPRLKSDKFAASISPPNYVDPVISINDFGELRIPLHFRQAEELREFLVAKNKSSTFIPSADFSLSSMRWKEFVGSLNGQILEALGIPSQEWFPTHLRCRGLVFFRENQQPYEFDSISPFAWHPSDPKFATVLLELVSSYEGGNLTIHRLLDPKTVIHECRAPRLHAWYSDTQATRNPITGGVSFALLYDLLAVDPTRQPPPLAVDAFASMPDELQVALRQWKTICAKVDDHVVHVFEGQDAYSYDMLEGRDRIMFNLLSKIGEELGLSVRLARLVVSVKGKSQMRPKARGWDTILEPLKPGLDTRKPHYSTYRLETFVSQNGEEDNSTPLETSKRHFSNPRRLKEIKAGRHPVELQDDKKRAKVHYHHAVMVVSSQKSSTKPATPVIEVRAPEQIDNIGLNSAGKLSSSQSSRATGRGYARKSTR